MKEKKNYNPPVIEFFKMDAVVSLIMTTINTPPNPNDPYGSAAQPIQESETEKSSFKENPFKR